MNTDITTELLIQYMDNELEPAQRQYVEDMLAQDSALRQQLEKLRLAKEAIGQYARRQAVAGIHLQAMQELRQAKPAPRVRWMRIALSLAAILVLLVLIGGIVQYSLLDANRLYQSKYEAYHLSTARGEGPSSQMERAYRQGKMQEITSLYERSGASGPYDHFLAGQAYLSTQEANRAIAAFEKQLSSNASSTIKPYQEDSEYYLGLAYLKSGNSAKALSIFENIKRQPAHAYHEEVGTWFLTKVRWLRD
jgi:tetratricopeptide (TPR) repeat protein